MTILRGHFAMVAGRHRGGAPRPRPRQALATLTADGSLVVTVRELPHEERGRAARHDVPALGARGRPARASSRR